MADNDRKDTLKGGPVPKSVEDKLTRGREEMRKDATLRRLCVKFWRGEQNWYLNDDGGLSFLPNALISVKKQPHRIRSQYRFIHSIVEGKVSQATQVIPGYDVTPSTTDPQDYAAARLASQVATYGYDKWHMRRVRAKGVTNALVQREAFVMPYFDPDVGPYRREMKLADDGLPELDKNGELVEEWVGQGEVRHLVLSRSEVMWEPGMDFEDSPWFAIERAMVKEEAERLPGFLGGEVQTDAQNADLPTERKATDNMVRVTQYYEYPCPDYPQGRCLTIMNKRVACRPDDYPSYDPDGNVTSDPILHRLSYTVDPEGDDRGMVEHLIDLARTIDDCWSKLREIKNRALQLQMVAPRGSNMPRRDDTPGATYEYNPTAAGKPEWEKPPDPAYIHHLVNLLELALAHMRAIAADVDVQPQPDLAAKTITAAVEANRSRWQQFIADVADWDSRIMRHNLALVARHYTAERQIEIRGQYDTAMLPDFTGQDLRSNVNVRVNPESLQAKTRQQVIEEIQFVQTNWPNAIGPDTAIALIRGGNADRLLKSPQYDYDRAARMVRLLEQGIEALTAVYQPTMRPMTIQVPDPMTGAPMTQTVMQEVPGWMPRKQDNIPIYKQVVGDYMKTLAYEQLPPDKQEPFNLFWAGLEFAEQERALEQAQLEQQMAAQLGMSNAAKPQGEIKQPDKPNPAQVPA